MVSKGTQVAGPADDCRRGKHRGTEPAGHISNPQEDSIETEKAALLSQFCTKVKDEKGIKQINQSINPYMTAFISCFNTFPSGRCTLGGVDSGTLLSPAHETGHGLGPLTMPDTLCRTELDPAQFLRFEAVGSQVK